MTSTKQRGSSGGSLLDSLKNSPATDRLKEQARGLASAQAQRLSSRLGDTVGSVTSSLGNVGESGNLPAVGEGAKRLLHGEGGGKAAVGAATTGIKEKAKGLLEKVTGKGKGSGQKKAVDIEESIDVGVPLHTAYDQWTQFTEFSRFMKGVESVEQSSETETNWRAKVFKSRRTWKATVQEQIPDQRIVWTSEGAKGSTKGVVTFHPLADNLTRILLTMEYFPHGLFEKTGNVWRAQGRRARLDLKNFRRFLMTEGEATGSWRGEVHDGQVTKGPDENDEDQGHADGEQAQDDSDPKAQRKSRDADDSGDSGDSQDAEDSEDDNSEQASAQRRGGDGRRASRSNGGRSGRGGGSAGRDGSGKGNTRTGRSRREPAKAGG